MDLYTVSPYTFKVVHLRETVFYLLYFNVFRIPSKNQISRRGNAMPPAGLWCKKWHSDSTPVFSCQYNYTSNPYSFFYHQRYIILATDRGLKQNISLAFGKTTFETRLEFGYASSRSLGKSNEKFFLFWESSSSNPGQVPDYPDQAFPNSFPVNCKMIRQPH